MRQCHVRIAPQKNIAYLKIAIILIKKCKNRVTFFLCGVAYFFFFFPLVADSASYHALGFNLWTSVPLSSLFNSREWNPLGLLPSLCYSFSLDLRSPLGAPLSYLNLKLEGLPTETRLPWAQHFFNYPISPILPAVTSFLIFVILVLSS